MSSFFSSSSYKPQAQIRQEGFHPHDPAFDVFAPFLPDPFRKFPAPAMDAADDLAFAPPDRDDRPFPRHIFDVSAPDAYPPHFAPPLPALSPPLRYENEPPALAAHFARHTPSPISRSRSRSRPPSRGPAPLGPARTARPRRNNSVGGTSPPPRPHAIVIPRSRAATVGGSGTANGWYTSPSDFSLPTPDSVTHHASPPNPYSPFSLSPPPFSLSPPPFSLSPPPDALHLPPVSALHSLQQPYLHGAPHSLPNIHSGLSGPPGPPGPPAPPPEPPKPPVSPADKQALLANEKRRRRRESHNAVERRRRDNINEKISELATLIPECMLDVASGPPPNPTDDPASPLDSKKDFPPTSPDPSHSSPGTPPPPPQDAPAIVKANKGIILRKSVEYIRYLQQLVEAQAARNRDLEAELKVWRAASAPAVSGGDALPWNTPPYAPGPNAAYFGLPTMPEDREGPEMDDDDDDDDDDAPDDSDAAERGRKLKRKKAVAVGVVKEEGAAPAEEQMMVL